MLSNKAEPAKVGAAWDHWHLVPSRRKAMFTNSQVSSNCAINFPTANNPTALSPVLACFAKLLCLSVLPSSLLVLSSSSLCLVYQALCLCCQALLCVWFSSSSLCLVFKIFSVFGFQALCLCCQALFCVWFTKLFAGIVTLFSLLVLSSSSVCLCCQALLFAGVVKLFVLPSSSVYRRCQGGCRHNN